MNDITGRGGSWLVGCRECAYIHERTHVVVVVEWIVEAAAELAKQRTSKIIQHQTLSSNILSEFVYGRVVANSSKMPSRDYIEDQELIYLSVEEVVDRFRNPVSPTLLVDCRPQEDFAASHIRGALNLTLPASLIMLRRLANGKLNVSSLISDPDSKEQFLKLWKDASLVLYDSDSDTRDNNKVFCTLLQRLHNEGCKVVCLQGKFSYLYKMFYLNIYFYSRVLYLYT